ncbi:hypothetical protein BU25DRAFT_417302 [Macroventuria anomochaeta]|uniref:Uncharacterized protein n=1 Tax=Macroventuria anomochaeta TaxID=301207 RepID=A0ACB6SEJ6_9PLEO|nr:uncharacterized protein BU25DRAFT_417302 [Macroventuria anomochaeta]KAF2632705.1 hypothetical protein BU25DRAFT_417302 [Macroventuria anomochaeta]
MPRMPCAHMHQSFQSGRCGSCRVLLRIAAVPALSHQLSATGTSTQAISGLQMLQQNDKRVCVLIQGRCKRGRLSGRLNVPSVVAATFALLSTIFRSNPLISFTKQLTSGPPPATSPSYYKRSTNTHQLLHGIISARSYRSNEVEHMLRPIQEPVTSHDTHIVAVSLGSGHSCNAARASSPLRSNRAPATPSVRRAGELQPISPSRIANTSARRYMGSALLHSPARLGHSACIRQIFDDTQQRSLGRQRTRDVIYPSLANVSRHVSPHKNSQAIFSDSSRHDRPQPQDQPSSIDTDATVSDPHVISPHTAELRPSPEPWSDDSGYLNASLSCISTEVAESPTERIYDWLSTTCSGELEGTADNMGENRDVDRERRVPGPRSSEVYQETSGKGSELLSNPPTMDAPQSVLGTRLERHVSDMCKTFNFDTRQA